MGGWDYYCPICGGPLYKPKWDYDPFQHHLQYNSEVLADDDDPELDWMEQCRLIGEKPGSKEEDPTVWLSGPATVDMFGSMDFEAGETPDPSLPDEMSTSVYYWDGDFAFSAPFHDKCAEVLRRYIGIPQLDNELFFQTIKSLATRSDLGVHLNIDYGDISPQMDTYWATVFGTEYFVFNPIEVKGIESIYEYLPSRDINATVEMSGTYITDGDPFAKLSLDVLVLLTAHVTDMPTLYKLRKASPTFANIPLTNGFWRLRIQNDMPWLWDFSASKEPLLHASVDWKQVYRRLDSRTRRSSKPDEISHGLCNRRRIYEQTCPQLAAAYNRLWANRQKYGTTQVPAELKAKAVDCKSLGGV